MAIHLTPEANPTVQEGTLYVDSATGEFNVAGRTTPHIIPEVLYPAVSGNDLSGTALGGSYVYGTAHTDGRKYYYTDIKGSKPIKDPRIGGHFGSQRHKFKSLQLLEQETATHGNNVYSIDGREWIRAVGANFEQEYNTKGSGIKISKVATDTNFIEIVGYFSDANIIRFTAADNDHLRVVLNGGTVEPTDLEIAVDSPLSTRYVDDGSVINLSFHSSSTPVLGINTVKILNTNADEYHINGIELIAQDTTSTANRSKIQIPSQDVVSYGKKFNVSGTPHYNPFNGYTATSSFSSVVDVDTSLGLEAWKHTADNNYYPPVNGGRIVNWVDSSGTIKTSVTLMPPNATGIGSISSNPRDANYGSWSSQYQPTFKNETERQLHEVAKTFHWREFGNGSANEGKVSSITGGSFKDVSMLESTADVSFVMDDGLTSFSGDDVNVSGYDYAVGSATLTPSGDLFYITFIGTGLTLSLPSSNATEIGTQYTIAQNLPYGTHVYKQERSGSNGIHTIDGVVVATSAPNGAKYIAIHQPKKPPIPEDAVVLCDYMLMADFVPQTSKGIDKISKGVRRCSVSRDVFCNETGGDAFSFAQDVNYASGFRLRLDGGADGVDKMKLRIPSFGTNIVHIGYASPTRSQIYIDSSPQTTTDDPDSNSNGSYQSIATNKDLGLYNWGINAVTGQNGATAGFDIATPIHTSHHYQSFETPYLHELVGGDRNMEQTNLVCSPDGRSWDQISRDTSFLSQVKVSCQIDHDSSAGNIVFDEWRGQNDAGLNAFNKSFAIAYDRLICLEEGTYQFNVIFSASTDGASIGINLYIDPDLVVSQYADHESGEKSSVAYSAVLTLKKGDIIIMSNAGTVEGTNPEKNQFSIVKL